MPTFDQNSSGSGIYTDSMGRKWGVFATLPFMQFSAPWEAVLVDVPAYGITNSRRTIVTSAPLTYFSNGKKANVEIIAQIENYIASWQRQQQGAPAAASDFPWWLVVIGGLWLVERDKRQRRRSR